MLMSTNLLDNITLQSAVTLSKISSSQCSLQEAVSALIRATALQSASLSAHSDNLIKDRPMPSHIISKHIAYGSPPLNIRQNVLYR